MLASDTKVVLFAAGLMFLWALLLGVAKYVQMSRSPDGLAHPYTDTAHRAALLYSFATGLVAALVQFSGFSQLVDLLAAGALVFFFAGAVFSYMVHGLRRDTDNQFRAGDQPPGLHPYMWALIAAEVGGAAVLLVGFAVGQW